MLIYQPILFFVLRGLFAFFTLHPFFVSVIEIDNNTKTHSMEIGTKVFTDDLEKAMEKKYLNKADFSDTKNKAAIDKLLSKYMNEHIVLSLDGKAMKMSYIGFEVQEESTWVFTEVPYVDKCKKLGVHCTFLYDYETRQSNIVRFVSEKKEQNLRLDYPKSDVTFSF